MKNRIWVRALSVLFVLAVLGASSLAVFALPAEPAAPASAAETNSGEEAEESAAPEEEDKEGETTSLADPETPQGIGPEEPVHLSYPTSVLFTFLAILAIVVAVRFLVKRNEKDKKEENENYNETY